MGKIEESATNNIAYPAPFVSFSTFMVEGKDGLMKGGEEQMDDSLVGEAAGLRMRKLSVLQSVL